MAPPRAPPELIDDAIAEILLRVPPDEPADLFRASLVCKPWLRVASDAAFLRRYRAFHRGAPLLGFFYYTAFLIYPHFFVPTAASPLTRPAYDVDDHDLRHWPVHDCRHGRVLYRNSAWNFVVWDPITGYREELPKLDIEYTTASAVVLCGAVAGCNHRECHSGPFLVFCVGCIYLEETTHVSMYSSEAHTWDTLDSTHLDGKYLLDQTRAALIGDAIYCSVDVGSRILKYDMVSHCFSLIDMPCKYGKSPILMQNEDGSLGLAGVSVRGLKLYVWSRMVNPDGVTGWVQQRAIKLKILRKFKSFGFAEGVGVFIMSTKVGVFTYELKSGRVREISGPSGYCNFFPFLSFFTPDYSCSKLPSLAETS